MKHINDLSRLAYLLLLTILYLFPYSVFAQWQNIQWTDGNEMLVCHQLSESQVLLIGTCYNDDGYGYLFNVKKTGTNSYDLQGTVTPKVMPKNRKSMAYEILSSKNYRNSIGTHWERKEVNGMDLLLCYEDGELLSVFEQTSLDLTEYTQDKIMEVFAGDYTSYGDAYKFSTDGTCIFKGKKTTFQMITQEPYDPEALISVDGTTYLLAVTMPGLNIFNVESGEPAHQAGLFAYLETQKDAPRWPDLSKYPLSSCVLKHMHKNALKIMRNEIYARHGWKFSNKDMDFYFRKCNWYKPGTDNSKIKLSKMELLNVALLKYYEQNGILD